MNSQAPQKTVLVFFGLIASGKSYLASSWAKRHDCFYLNTDVVRKQLAGLAPQTRRAEDADAGIYSSAWTRKTYKAMREKAEDALIDPQGGCVILDGSYGQQKERSALLESLGGLARLAFIYCHCGETTTRTRLAKRALDPTAVSDGRWDVFVRQRQLFEAPDELAEGLLLDLDTELSREMLFGEIATFLKKQSSP